MLRRAGHPLDHLWITFESVHKVSQPLVPLFCTATNPTLLGLPRPSRERHRVYGGARPFDPLALPHPLALVLSHSLSSFVQRSGTSSSSVS